MSESFVVLWTLERCRWLQRVRDHGPLEVIFGGPHRSLPTIESVTIGDAIYPVCVIDGTIHVIARMHVSSLVPPEEYVAVHFGFTRLPGQMWDVLYQELKRSGPDFGHRFPTTCCDRAATSVNGSDIRFDRPISAHQMQTLTFGPKPGREKPLKGLTSGRLRSVFSLQGHVRRLSAPSAAVFEACVGEAPRVETRGNSA